MVLFGELHFQANPHTHAATPSSTPDSTSHAITFNPRGSCLTNSLNEVQLRLQQGQDWRLHVHLQVH